MEEESKDVDVFDLSDLSDLPQNIKAELKVNARDPFEKNIIDIFRKASRELEIDQVTVAYYRLFKEAKERKQIMAKLYNMSRTDRPAIQSVAGKKGVYKLILGGDE